MTAVIVLRRREERAGLIATYLVTAVFGAVITLTPGGLSASDADYAARFFVAVLALLVGGLAVGGGCFD